MNKSTAIKLLNSEGWTKEDAKRALASIDFKVTPNPDEIIIRQATSKFAGSELINRQRLQAAQKTLVTKRNKKIQEYIIELEEYKSQLKTIGNGNPELQVQVVQLTEAINSLKNTNQSLLKENQKLTEANHVLQKDNKNLKNIKDMIQLQLTVEIKEMIKMNDIKEIKKRLYKLLKSILG